MISHRSDERIIMPPHLVEEFVIHTAIEMKRMRRERQQELTFNLTLIAFVSGVLVCVFGFVLGASIH